MWGQPPSAVLRPRFIGPQLLTSKRIAFVLPVRYNASQRRNHMPATEMVHVRIEKRIKTQAAKTLAAMGLSVSDAVRVLLTRVAAEKALPFEVKVPNHFGGGDARSTQGPPALV